jgi:hypothetical protein
MLVSVQKDEHFLEFQFCHDCALFYLLTALGV